MNKLTDNESVKALECCKIDDCKSCPLSNYDGCKSLLFDGDIVLDLINRQKAENERLVEIIEKGDFSSYSALKAIADRRIKNLEYINKLKAEIERLKPFEKKVGIGVLENLKQLEYEKTEAIKEFAERLKEPYKDYDKNVGVVGKTALFNDIDDLVKEMTE